jgi:hypothetical protein
MIAAVMQPTSHVNVDGGDLHDQIVDLEARIEKLTEVAARCRKIALMSKLAMAAGAAWLLAFTLGAIGFDPAAMTGAIAAVIGGIVVFGSNSTTAKQTASAIKAAEALRTELIGRIDPRVVGEANVDDPAS